MKEVEKLGIYDKFIDSSIINIINPITALLLGMLFWFSVYLSIM